jgi:hypothetical protein
MRKACSRLGKLMRHPALGIPPRPALLLNVDIAPISMCKQGIDPWTKMFDFRNAACGCCDS